MWNHRCKKKLVEGFVDAKKLLGSRQKSCILLLFCGVGIEKHAHHKKNR